MERGTGSSGSTGIPIPEDGLVSGEFRFERLAVSGIDNEPVFRLNDPGMRNEEICLVHKGCSTGDDCVSQLSRRITDAIAARRPLPVVRFADGEYAFYSGSLACNGLYHQAESAEAIRASFPMHIENLRFVAENGILAPLVFPGNIGPLRRRFPKFWKTRGDDGAARFLAFLAAGGITLTGENYLPFYAVYAALSHPRLARALDGRTVCVVNSDFDAEACVRWFAAADSRPRIVHAPIPKSLVATRWASMRDEVLAGIPADAGICLVGAGVGALPVCADIARRIGIPAVDAGHIVNVMNNLEGKSSGPRLYTFPR